MERVREIDAGEGLPDAVRGEAGRLKGLDGRWTRKRGAVADVMDMADRTLGAHEGLAPEDAGAWLGKAAGTVGLGRSVAEDMTAREIAAHLAAAGQEARRVRQGDGRHRGPRQRARRRNATAGRRTPTSSCFPAPSRSAWTRIRPCIAARCPMTSGRCWNRRRSDRGRPGGRGPRGRGRDRAETGGNRHADRGGARAQPGRHVRGAGAVRGRPGLQQAACTGRRTRTSRRRRDAAPGARGAAADGDRGPRRARRRRDAGHGTRGAGVGHGGGARARNHGNGGGNPEGARGGARGASARTGPEGEGTIGWMVREEAVLRRVSACFTGAEVRGMCEGRGPVMDGLPGDAARTRVRDVMRQTAAVGDVLGPRALAGAAGDAGAGARAGPGPRGRALHGHRAVLSGGPHGGSRRYPCLGVFGASITRRPRAAAAAGQSGRPGFSAKTLSIHTKKSEFATISSRTACHGCRGDSRRVIRRGFLGARFRTARGAGRRAGPARTAGRRARPWTSTESAGSRQATRRAERPGTAGKESSNLRAGA